MTLMGPCFIPSSAGGPAVMEDAVANRVHDITVHSHIPSFYHAMSTFEHMISFPFSRARQSPLTLLRYFVRSTFVQWKVCAWCKTTKASAKTVACDTESRLAVRVLFLPRCFLGEYRWPLSTPA